MATKSIREKYKQHDLRTHIYELPDTYAGSQESTSVEMYIFDDNEKKLVKRIITYIPVIYKCFDEIIVNALDQITRVSMENKPGSKPVKTIKVNVDKQSGYIEVMNDGDGIEIEKHPDQKMYVPEMIFGNLLTSANYDKSEEKVIGGKNGVGAKLANIFSKEFIVETLDHRKKKRYIQRFHNNMLERDAPEIEAAPKAAPFTKIRFLPDYARFGLSGLTDDMYELFRKRTMDACACTDANVSIFFNEEKIPYKSFETYVDLYLGCKDDHPRVYEKVNDRWEVVATYSPSSQFEHVSFVNGINTFRGGKHVDYITNQVTKKLAQMISTKKKKEVKPQHIRDNMFLFVKSTIVNPSFDSQTKEFMTTETKNFGSKCELSDKFFDKLYKTGITEKAVSLTDFHDTKKLSKTDGKKTSRVIIPNLDDAAKAGTKDSHDCTLILTEGLSARTMAISGLSVVGREKYGVFPLRGKILNVRDVKADRIYNNQEISHLKKILGLEQGKEYKDLSSLRYGRIMALTDSDDDGFHIKGLLFNVFQSLWPSLFKQQGFLTSMLTPIVKATNKQLKQTLSFYSSADFERWRENTDQRGWSCKYYKGLGTSKEDEAKEYFKEMKQVIYKYDGQTSDASIDLAFNSKRADDRKKWLMEYDRNAILDYAETEVPYSDFIHKELKHFSNRDLERSIPNICDGLKESTRKILYTCFKRGLTKNEIRVAQLAGSVSELTAYHHGEASLQKAIIGMAQIFVAANNINLLQPNGQFGTRLQGGQDAASPRYIHTLLSPLAMSVFREEDQCILKYRDDDGLQIEPEYYIPIIPMVLVNGAIGIGTGFSTSIPCYNPSDLIECCFLAVKALDEAVGDIRSEPATAFKDDLSRAYDTLMSFDMPSIHPWYLGFRGTIVLDKEHTYASRGVYTWLTDTMVEITELPINIWTDDFKDMLDNYLLSNHEYLKDYENHSTAKNVKFILKFTAAAKKHYDKTGSFEKDFKLSSTKQLSMRNQHLYDSQGKIQKYHDISEIVREWACVRIKAYFDRKQYLLEQMRKEFVIVSAKVKFIREIIAGDVVVMNRPQSDVENQLRTREYPPHPDDEANPYQYLVRMPIYQLTKEKKEALEKEAEDLKAKMEGLQATPIQHIWKKELEELKAEWEGFHRTVLEDYEADLNGESVGTGGKKKRVMKK